LTAISGLPFDANQLFLADQRVIPQPSGLYVRFVVPVNARSIWGSRFILKSLSARRGDEARAAAARLG
jgi:hypothetical protein